MRFLIVAVAVFACAAAAPSGLLAAPYAAYGYAAPVAVAHAAPIAVAHAAPLAVAHPTVNPGDIAGAAIDAHVEAADHVRAAVDQNAELTGQAINHAEESSWQALNAVQTHAAAVDGAAAGVSPVLAKQVAGHAAYAAPVAYAAAPAAYAAAPVAYAAAPLAHSAVVAHAAPLAHGYVASAPVAYGHAW